MPLDSLSELRPVYLIHGGEDLLLQRAVHRLREKLASEADIDFNFDAFDGATADAEEIVAAANTLPFMSDRRLIVVWEVDRMNSAGQAALADYAADPAPHACLVLTAAKLSRSSKLFKAVSALKGVAEYAAPKRGEYPKWVIGLFREHGKAVGADAAEALVRAVGTDLRRLAIEIAKVCSFVGDVETISKEDIESVMSTTAPTSIFDFLDALGFRDCRGALRMLASLLGEGESLLGIHAMSLRHVRNLLSARSLLDRGSSTRDVSSLLGLQEWQGRNLVRQADRFEAGELMDALRAAAGAEEKMKTSQEARLAFERWLVGVCGEDG